MDNPDQANRPGGGTPRWVKVGGVVLGLVVVLVLAAALVGGEHGPQRHGASHTPVIGPDTL